MWHTRCAACLLAAAALAASGAWMAQATHAAPSDARAQVFASREVIEFALAAPFDDLFAAAVRAPDASVRGRISYLAPASHEQIVIEGVEVSVRGNSSRRFTECPFPKLKLRFPKGGATEGSVFGRVRTLKIGTHCDDRPDGELTFQFGRWPNEKSPWREFLVYRLLEAADVPVALTRPARITYVFEADGPSPSVRLTPNATSRSPARRSIVRNALLLEDDDDAMARLGAAAELTVPGGEPPGHGKTAGTFENAARRFSALDSARVAFAEAMIGNFDWALRFYPGDLYRDDGKKGLWNVRALVRADGTSFPLIQDFDLAGIVTGNHRWYEQVFPERFGEAASRPAVEVLAQIQRTRSLFDRPVLDATRAAFLARKGDILSAAGEVSADAGGKANAHAYLAAFFDAVASDDAFYRPVVMRADVVAWATPEEGQPSCGPNDRIPIGTPVGAPFGQSGALARVELLDVFWHWANRCGGIRQQPVWVRADAIEKSYPSK